MTRHSRDESVTVGVLAGRVGLSRTTLLYYDRIGLLSPSARSDKGYRRYSVEDQQRLAQICAYRRFGLKLSDIAALLQDGGGAGYAILADHFQTLGRQINQLREQQRQLLDLMGVVPEAVDDAVMNKERWSELMRAAGFDDQAMHAWHCRFEQNDPDRHAAFLRFLCLSDGEIERIRCWSRDNQTPPTP